MTGEPISWVSLHAGVGFEPVGPNVALIAVLVLGGLASTALVVLGAIAFSYRRSRSYLLVTLALSALTVKATVGGLSTFGLMAIGQHHVLEHGLDFTIAVLLIAAVYDARTAPEERERESSGEETR